MIIRRMQVEGGFLDGFDLRFEEGLNVIIGGRGTGKSSVIELIRYCLDIRGSANEEDSKRSREQALSVLEDGQVTLYIEDNGSNIVVSRAANTNPDSSEFLVDRPLIFSQKDVESVGLSARGRLNIVDIFSTDGEARRATERKTAAQVQSLTVEITGLILEADQVLEKLVGADSVQVELLRAEARSAEMAKHSIQLDRKQKQLENISTQSSRIAVRNESLRRALEATIGNRDELSNLVLFGFAVDLSPTDDPRATTAAIREKLARAERLVDQAHELMISAVNDFENAIQDAEKERTPLEEQARTIRREIEGLKEGAGAAARQLSTLREQVSQLDALKELRAQKLERASRVRQQRGKLLDQLEAIRDARCFERQRVAEWLTATLSPAIRIKIRGSAQITQFTSAIANALRGSGLRYNELANSIAASITPRELVEAVEKNDAPFISKNAKISTERAERVITQLRTVGGQELVSIPLEDIADFELLDGQQFKPMDEISVGQRCTVVLSILLQHPDRILIVDQPEDHLDNAFIVDTLIEAIRSRSAEGQLIFSTHNANIPVLGAASRVVRLGSNGKRGFVMHAKALDDPASVASITSIMEGGSDAFRQRSRFYNQSSNK